MANVTKVIFSDRLSFK